MSDKYKPIKNADLWVPIEDEEPFSSGHALAWHYLEKLQTGGRLSGVDLINLHGLIREVYEAGIVKGKEQD